MSDKELFKNHQVELENNGYVLFKLNDEPFISNYDLKFTLEDADYAIYGKDDEMVVALVRMIQNPDKDKLK